MLKIRVNDRLGGVPINVAIPPIDAEYAMLMSNPTENRDTVSLSTVSLSLMMIAIATVIGPVGQRLVEQSARLFHVHRHLQDVFTRKRHFHITFLHKSPRPITSAAP